MDHEWIPCSSSHQARVWSRYMDVLNYDIRGTIDAEDASLDDAISADADYRLVAVDYG